MKRLIFLSLTFAVLTLASCSPSPQPASPKPVPPKHVEPIDKRVDVLLNDTSIFPAALAGYWKEEVNGWEFIIAADGTIPAAVIDAGRASVKPPLEEAIVKRKDGSEVIYKLGRWSVEYSEKTRELMIEVVVDHYHMDIKSGGALEGKTKDIFIGIISEDFKTWEAQWFSFPEYVIISPDATEPIKVPTDPDQSLQGNVVFIKQ